MNGLKRLSEPGGCCLSLPSHAPGRQRPLANRLLQALGLCVLMVAGSSAGAQESVYTWKDAKGRVHYGNRLPEGQTAEPVNLNSKSISVEPADRIYTWTDAEGKAHYAAQPPPDVHAKEVKEDDSSFSTIHSGQLREGEKKLLREIKGR